MKRLLAVGSLLVLAACGGGNTGASPESESLLDMCVRQTTALYKKHDLPPADQLRVCEEFLKDYDVKTKADLEIRLRTGDKILRDLEKD